MLCRNESQQEVSFNIDRSPGMEPLLYRVPPGGEVDIEDGYCVPYKTENGRVMDPLICQITRLGGRDGNGPAAMKPTGRFVAGQVRGRLPNGAVMPAQDPSVLPSAELLGVLTALQAQIAKLESQVANQAAALQAVAVQTTPTPPSPTGPRPPVTLTPEQDSLGSDEEDAKAAATAPAAPTPEPKSSLGGGKGKAAAKAAQEEAAKAAG